MKNTTAILQKAEIPKELRTTLHLFCETPQSLIAPYCLQQHISGDTEIDFII